MKTDPETMNKAQRRAHRLALSTDWTPEEIAKALAREYKIDPDVALYYARNECKRRN